MCVQVKLAAVHVEVRIALVKRFSFQRCSGNQRQLSDLCSKLIFGAPMCSCLKICISKCNEAFINKGAHLLCT